MEPHDAEMLSNPSAIIDSGGHILFAMDADSPRIDAAATGDDDPRVLGVVALVSPGIAGAEFELAKMGVRESARGRGVSRALGNAAVALAAAHGADSIDIVSNRRLKPALALYGSLGFVEGPMPSTDYARADIYLSLQLKQQQLQPASRGRGLPSDSEVAGLAAEA